MGLFFVFISASLAAGNVAAAPSECCDSKSVGGVKYRFVSEAVTSQYNCLQNCIYERVGHPGSKFCFAPGDLTVVCEDAPVRLIIDTDMSFDVGDVGALCAAHAMADRGEVDILAVVHNTGYPKAIGAVSVINHYYGRDDILLGAFKGDFGKNISGKYIDHLVDEFHSPINNYDQVPEPVPVLRKVLAASDDYSVVISSIGFLTNIANLLKSKADDISSFTGYELVRDKVKLVAVMGGQYPSGSEFNFNCGQHWHPWSSKTAPLECEGTAQNAMMGMPPSVKMVFSGFEVGEKVFSGGALTGCAPKTNPCRKAHIDYRNSNEDTESWDPLTTIFAVRGASAISCEETGHGGKNEVMKNGSNTWEKGEDSRQTYLVLNDPKKAGHAIDQLLCAPPLHG